jgi:signal peptidase I
MQQEPNTNPTHETVETEQPKSHRRSLKHREGLKSALSTLLILIAAPLVAYLIVTFVFQSYEVDGPSMETTLHNHDRLIVLKAPRTLARIEGKSYIPARGSIIVFKQKLGLTVNGTDERQLIKRVIGLPGDRVVVKDDVITIYNKEHPDGYNPDANQSWSDVVTKTGGGPIDRVIGDDEVFVCGDNRANSLDSRVFGPIKVDTIVGKLSLRILPANTAKHF